MLLFKALQCGFLNLSLETPFFNNSEIDEKNRIVDYFIHTRILWCA
jgi:hypothetical protein